jgi:hypothetical protein
MPLSSTLELFGEVAIAPGEPPVMRNVDCVYAPFSAEVFFDRDPSWGIYSPGGSIIPAAAYVRGEKLGLIGQSQSRIFALDSLHNKNE